MAEKLYDTDKSSICILLKNKQWVEKIHINTIFMNIVTIKKDDYKITYEDIRNRYLK